MNKKGFSLIELLTVIIILGVVATIGISAVSGYINDSRKSSFSDLAKMYIEKASELRTVDRLPVEIKDGEALLLPLERFKLEKNEDYTTVYGKLKLDFCYVIITNNSNNYNYYISMLDDTKHAIVFAEYSKISKELITMDPIEIALILNYKAVDASSRFIVNNTAYEVKTVGDNYLVLKR